MLRQLQRWVQEGERLSGAAALAEGLWRVEEAAALAGVAVLRAQATRVAGRLVGAILAGVLGLRRRPRAAGGLEAVAGPRGAGGLGAASLEVELRLHLRGAEAAGGRDSSYRVRAAMLRLGAADQEEALHHVEAILEAGLRLAEAGQVVGRPLPIPLFGVAGRVGAEAGHHHPFQEER